MTDSELDKILERFEWRDLEFKKCSEVSRSAFETVSAFQNTEGGHILLGITDSKEIEGITDVDKVQQSFISGLKDLHLFSSQVEFEEELIKQGDKNVLLFFIPEAARKNKPVYVKTKKKGYVAFVRKGGEDYVCTKVELDRLISDAQETRPDGELLDIDPADILDVQSVKWYRHRYENKGGNRSLDTFSDDEFLTELGLLVEHKGGLLPTMALGLLLGKTSRIRQLLPRPIVDCYRYGFESDHANTGRRWDKRVTCELNIVNSWQSVVDWYNSFTDNPFHLDQGSGQRTDIPPDFVAFRELVINLLSHQDYTDHGRTPTIEDFTDLTRFWNPGDAFANANKLLEPGNKEVRNPVIVRALRDIGFSEQSGWGLREVYRNWSNLGRVPPTLRNDRSEKYFGLELRRQTLISEEQVLFQSQIGVTLSQQEAEAFANLCAAENAQITHAALRAAMALNGAETSKIVTRLLVQGIAARINDRTIGLSEHLLPLKKQLFSGKLDLADTKVGLSTEKEGGVTSDLSTEQVGDQTPDLSTEQVEPLKSLTDKQKALLVFCDVPRSMAEIQDHVGAVSRGYFKNKHLAPLLDHSLMAMTIPEKPRSSKQRYVVTQTGVTLIAAFQKSASAQAEETE